MPSGNILTATDVLNLLVSGIVKTSLETELTASGWTSTLAKGGSKSGQGTIWTSPDVLSSVRIMTQPNGSSYSRVYNGPGGGAPGEQPLNASGKPGSRQQTHFIRKIGLKPRHKGRRWVKIEKSTGSRHVETATVRAHLDSSDGQCLTATLKTTSILLAYKPEKSPNGIGRL